MNGDQAYAYALANAERNTDGTIVERALVEIVAHAVDFDADEARLGQARRIVARRKRPGQTASEGSVVFPGLEHYAYEPYRLIADDDGNVVENQHAHHAHKQAEARRADLAAQRAHDRWEMEQLEADHFAEWERTELAKGRDPQTLTWDACVRETGLWKDQEPETSDEDQSDGDAT
jgi:hypothetical protein